MQTNPVKVIREKCIDCCCGMLSEVANCTIEKCPLWPFRFGKNPFRKKTEMTQERKEILAQARQARRNGNESNE